MIVVALVMLVACAKVKPPQPAAELIPTGDNALRALDDFRPWLVRSVA